MAQHKSKHGSHHHSKQHHKGKDPMAHSSKETHENPHGAMPGLAHGYQTSESYQEGPCSVEGVEDNECRED